MSCDTCGGSEVGVACCPLGAFSVAYCRECLLQDAHPLWAIHATLDCIGGSQYVADWVKLLKSHKDGKYIGWDEIVSLYVPDPEMTNECA